MKADLDAALTGLTYPFLPGEARSSGIPLSPAVEAEVRAAFREAHTFGDVMLLARMRRRTLEF